MFLFGERQLIFKLASQVQAKIAQVKERAYILFELFGVAARKTSRELDQTERSASRWQ